MAGGWSLLAVAAAFLASRRGSVTLGLHAGVYGLAAAWVSGLLGHAGHALAASAGSPWPELRPTALVTLAALAVASSLELPADSPVWGRTGVRVPKLLLLAVLAWGGFGVLGATATAAALLLAWLGRFRRFREAGWLVYPVLVAGGFKLILEDFLLGRAAELFAALGLYGAVLIVAPRLARASRRPPPTRRRGAGSAPGEEP